MLEPCDRDQRVAPASNSEKLFGYYHRSRTHLSLDKDAPESRPVQELQAGRIIQIPEVGGLHHRFYEVVSCQPPICSSAVFFAFADRWKFVSSARSRQGRADFVRGAAPSTARTDDRSSVVQRKRFKSPHAW